MQHLRVNSVVPPSPVAEKSVEARLQAISNAPLSSTAYKDLPRLARRIRVLDRKGCVFGAGAGFVYHPQPPRPLSQKAKAALSPSGVSRGSGDGGDDDALFDEAARSFSDEPSSLDGGGSMGSPRVTRGSSALSAARSARSAVLAGVRRVGSMRSHRVALAGSAAVGKARDAVLAGVRIAGRATLPAGHRPSSRLGLGPRESPMGRVDGEAKPSASALKAHRGAASSLIDAASVPVLATLTSVFHDRGPGPFTFVKASKKHPGHAVLEQAAEEETFHHRGPAFRACDAPASAPWAQFEAGDVVWLRSEGGGDKTEA
jgi:hypothetical protein